MNETPAETIRRAAALMRERGQAVQHYRYPWRNAGPNHSDTWDEWTVAYATDEPLAGLIATTPDYGVGHLPDYIASMHPGVDLALADWLDEVADDRHASLPHWVQEGALRIARAYLGEPS